MLVVPKQGKPVAPAGQEMLGEVIETKRFNIYNGIWVCDTDIMLKWDVSANQIKPYQNGVDVFFSYSVICPNATGSLIPSIIEKAMSPIRQMILIRLKMQQLISTMRPDGYQIDISGFRDVDLGLGDTAEPLKLMKIWDQTGRVYWDSTGEDGERKAQPIVPLNSNNNVAQLNMLIGQYNFELDRLREEMGISEYRDGSSVPTKTGLGVMNQQIQSSNNATEYIYEASMKLFEDTCRKISMMLWDSVVLKAVKFKEFEGYEMSLLDMTFDVRVNLINDQNLRNEMNQMLNIAVQGGSISYEQAFKVKNIEDTKLAELYLARAMKKAKKEAELAAQQNSQMNGQLQQQSIQAKSQADAQLEQMITEGKMAINKSKGDSDKEIELIKFASLMYSNAISKGQELPESIKALADTILKNAIQPQIDEQIAKQQQMEQEALQAEQQQVAPEEMPPEQQMEQQMEQPEGQEVMPEQMQ
jgi:hypothetical protein